MFTVYRIIGNDLPPRHEQNCALECTKIIVEQEQLPANVHRRWLLNRIYDSDTQDRWYDFFEDRNIPYDTINFEPSEYAALQTQEQRVMYLTNVNAARNFAVREGFNYGDVVLPLDSRSVFSLSGWEQFATGVAMAAHACLYVLGQARLSSRDFKHELSVGTPSLYETYNFTNKKVTSKREPAVAFSRNSDLLFDENLVYGNAEKAELLLAYNVQGIWSHWTTTSRKTKSKRNAVSCGWTSVLPTLNTVADTNNLARGAYRVRALEALLERVNEKFC